MKYRLWMLALGSAVGIQTASSGDVSFLKNGNFEEGTSSSWSVADWSPAAVRKPVEAVIETKNVPEGSYACRIVTEGTGGNLVLRQEFSSKGAGRYRLKLLCRPDPGSDAYASGVGHRGGEILVYETTEKIANPDVWTPLELIFDVPEQASSVRVLLRTTRGAVFDDVSCSRIGELENSSATEPSSAAELEKKKSAETYGSAFDQTRKAGMSADELAWEQTLEKNLGPFYLPRYKAAKERGEETAWDYVDDQPGLPRVLLIGDSISRGYTLAVRHALAGKVNVHRVPANCSSTVKGLSDLDGWLGDGKWDLIHFNFGIHDQNSSAEEYGKRLEQITERLKATGAKLIFATSTPMPSDSDQYRSGACRELNQTALQVMKRQQVPVNDLYAAVLPRQAEFQKPSDCHFSDEGYQFMGNLVAGRILEKFAASTIAAVPSGHEEHFMKRHRQILERNKTGPVGLVFLGDSITEGWGKAWDVWKKYFGDYNPANLGVGGDQTEHVLWRIENGELDGISPRVVVLLVGTNNHWRDSSEDIVAGIKAVMTAVQRKLPATKILLMGIFPRGTKTLADGTVQDHRPIMEKIRAVNCFLAGMDNGTTIRYLDISEKFYVNGELPSDIMPDQLHPSPVGYAIWAEAIAPVLKDMMAD